MNDLNKDKSFSTPEKKSKTLIPYAMLCELTHRCPLSCPYCSNPVELELKSNETSTDLWKTALSDGAKIGILQAHFSGGEPTARKDLEELVSHASKIGLYTNLITSGVLIKEDRLKNLYERSYWICLINDINVQLSNGSLFWIKNNKINLNIFRQVSHNLVTMLCLSKYFYYLINSKKLSYLKSCLKYIESKF